MIPETPNIWRPSQPLGPADTTSPWLVGPHGSAEATSERRISVASGYKAFENWQFGDPTAIDHSQTQAFETGDTYVSRIDNQLESSGAKRLANIIDFLHTKTGEDASQLIYSTAAIGGNEVKVDLIPVTTKDPMTGQDQPTARARFQGYFNTPFENSYYMTAAERTTLDTHILGRQSAVARANADLTSGW
ncbi:hypothetical protein KSF_086500 [Reticulibacter mediterranei]|uniref:Uncharacterized protein n=2 Tax=Reticulibacter mediterranei TaxID=2778369 RepID=A0A8J3N4U7_9CHLR|nr:hypothetical protein KSF_086500 [Reticulibacter mediterranei]